MEEAVPKNLPIPRPIILAEGALKTKLQHRMTASKDQLRIDDKSLDFLQDLQGQMFCPQNFI